MKCAQQKQQLWRHLLCLFMAVVILMGAVFGSPVEIVKAADAVQKQVVTEDLPLIYGVHPANMAFTYNRTPAISASFEKAGADIIPASMQVILDGQVVTESAQVDFDATTQKGTVLFQPAANLSYGEHDVTVSVSDTANKTNEYTWYFIVDDGVSAPNFYYGIPHSHTSFSDGQGTPADAYQHAYEKGLDFLAVTDHSNLLEGDMYVESSGDFQAQPGSEWTRTKEMADTFNQQYPDFLALRGFEMTSDEWGHINVHNTDRYVEAKNTMTSLDDFYNWLGTQPGSVGEFNHPNWPAGSFNNMAYAPEADRYIQMSEVGNGAPPSRIEEYYYKALDNGWHVGAVNAQDNHLTNWGDSDNLTVIVADQLTKDEFLEALRERRVYSTESRTLQLTVKANGYWMGSVLDLSEGEQLNFDITAADSAQPIEKLELITNGGIVIDTLSFGGKADVAWQPSVTPGHGANWYVVKVTLQSDKLGFSSPIFTAAGKNDVRLVNLKANPDPCLVGSDMTLTATVANLGECTADNLEVKFYHDDVSGGNLIASGTIAHLASGEREEVQVVWKPSSSGQIHLYAELTNIPGVTTFTEISHVVTVTEEKNVKIRVEGATESKAEATVTVSGTALEALKAAVGEQNVEAPGGFITGILGESGQQGAAPNTDTYWMYYVIRGGEIEPGAFSSGSSSYIVADGDEVIFYIGAYDTTTWSAKTYFPLVSVDPAQPKAGDTVILSLGAKKYDWMSGLADLSVEEAVYIGDYNLTINGATYTSQNGRVTLPDITEGELHYTVSNPNSLGYPDVITCKGNITVEPTSLTLQVPGGAVPGGTIKISGKLNNSAVAGVSIGVTIKDPTGSLVYVDETRASDNASFEFSFTLPGNAPYGEWQVQVAGGGATASKTFSVGGPAGVVNASPSSVKPGGAVTISGKVAQGGVPVGITVKNPSGGVAIVDQTMAGADGGYSFQFNLPADAPTGAWTADVAGGGSAGRATFELTSPPQPAIELDVPSSAVTGETLEIKGQYTGEEVSGVPMAITVKNSNGAVFYVDETSTGTDGAFSFSLTIPADAPTGVWTVDVAGGGANAYQSFYVGEPADNKVSVNVSPSSVKPGGTVTFSGKVPQDNVPVGITVKDPNGGVAFVEQTTAGADGGYSFQFNLPADAPTGTWTADVAGGGSSGSATFTVKSSSGGGGGGGSSSVVSACKQPVVAGCLPQAEASGVALDALVSVTFDIAVDKVSSTSLNSITIKDESGNKVGGVAAALSGTKLTISHDAFVYNTKYTVTIPENALVCGGSSDSGYYNKGISWSFTTLKKPEASLVAEQNSGYSDVSPSHWAFNDITALGAKGIIKGYPDGTFKPDNNITRAEFAVLLAKALGWPAKPGGLGFADASEIPDWARGYISAAMDKVVISGFEDNTFKPNRPITRSEIAVIVVRALGLAPEAGVLNFSDASEIPDWAEGYIAAAVNQGIIVGKPGNIFAPDDNATRAEAASLVLRLMNSLGI